MAPEQRREQLLDATLRVIVEQGVHKVSIDTVAKAAGVSRPVVYSLFDDSDALLRASLDREEAGALAQVAAVLPLEVDDQSTPHAAIAIALEGYMSAVHDAPDRWRAIFQLANSSTPAFSRRVEKGRRAFTSTLTAFVCNTTPRTTQSAFDSDLTARILQTLFWEASRITLAEPDRYPPDRVTNYMAAAIAAIPYFADTEGE